MRSSGVLVLGGAAVVALLLFAGSSSGAGRRLGGLGTTGNREPFPMRAGVPHRVVALFSTNFGQAEGDALVNEMRLTMGAGGLTDIQIEQLDTRPGAPLTWRLSWVTPPPPVNTTFPANNVEMFGNVLTIQSVTPLGVAL